MELKKGAIKSFHQENISYENLMKYFYCTNEISCKFFGRKKK